MANMDVILVYIISFFMFYFILTGIVMIYFRKLLLYEWRKRFMIKRGYGYIRIYGNDKRVREYFTNLKKDKITIQGKAYLIKPKMINFIGSACLFSYREGIAEPINLYSKNIIGIDSKHLEGFLLKMKMLAKVIASKEMKWVLYAAVGAIIAAAVSALLGYTNYQTLQDIASKVVG